MYRPTKNSVFFRMSKIISHLNKHFPLTKNEIRTKLTYPAKNKYTLLVALILSASTTDKQVNNVTNILFKRANTPLKMIKLGQKEIEKIIKSAGLHKKKASYIIKMSHILLDRGQMPKLKKDLIKLPGVGNKIAGVFIINSDSKETDFPVDTHVKQFAIRHKLTKHTAPSKISEDLKKKFPEKYWAKLHYQMIAENRMYA